MLYVYGVYTLVALRHCLCAVLFSSLQFSLVHFSRVQSTRHTLHTRLQLTAALHCTALHAIDSHRSSASTAREHPLAGRRAPTRPIDRSLSRTPPADARGAQSHSRRSRPSSAASGAAAAPLPPAARTSASAARRPPSVRHFSARHLLVLHCLLRIPTAGIWQTFARVTTPLQPRAHIQLLL